MLTSYDALSKFRALRILLGHNPILTETLDDIEEYLESDERDMDEHETLIQQRVQENIEHDMLLMRRTVEDLKAAHQAEILLKDRKIEELNNQVTLLRLPVTPQLPSEFPPMPTLPSPYSL